jgi:hypothetical protein
MAGTRKRNKVVAEITQAYIRQLALKFGCPISEDHVLAFLNQDGHAYAMWMRMMEAAEDFIMSNLPKLPSESGTTPSNGPGFQSDNRYFPVYATSANAKSDLNRALRT